jgi:polar amino acid transport system substrate-binding protein
MISKALPVVALAAWAAGVSAVPAASLEEVRRDGHLRVAVYRDFTPFADDGKGIDVEVAKALAAKLGVAADVKAYPEADDVDGDLRNIIWRGHHLWREPLADVMMHVPVDPHVIQKNDKVRIFAPYFRERLVVARNRARIPQLPTLQIFTTEKIGVEAETLEDRYLVGSFGGLLRENVVHFKSLNEAAAALLRGDVSAVMGRQTILEAALGKEASRFEITAAPAPGIATTGWELGLAVKADYPDLAEALSKAMADLLRDGTVQRIFASRGLSYRAPVGAAP